MRVLAHLALSSPCLTSSSHLAYLTSVSRILASSRPADNDMLFDFTTSFIRPSTPPRSAIPPLPLELVLAIIESACQDHSGPNTQLLKACSLVCKTWSLAAQKMLFANVTLTSQTACDAFSKAVDRRTVRGQTLGDAVIRMRVTLDHNQPFGLAQLSFAQAFASCPRMSELSISLYGSSAPGEDIVGSPDVMRMRRPAPSFDEQSLALLRSGPSIETLHFSNWSENQETISQLLDLWPGLKSLSISGTAPNLSAASLPPFPAALEELDMNFQTNPSVDSLSWLLHNSRDSLRVLRFKRDPPAALLDYLMEYHGHMLHTLSMPTCAPEHARLVQQCDQLREFVVECPPVSVRVLKHLPRGIEHVALGVDRNTALQPLLELVRAPDSGLRVVSLNAWHGGEEHHQMASLKMACAYRGVELRFAKDVQAFRSMMMPDAGW